MHRLPLFINKSKPQGLEIVCLKFQFLKRQSLEKTKVGERKDKRQGCWSAPAKKVCFPIGLFVLLFTLQTGKTILFWLNWSFILALLLAFNTVHSTCCSLLSSCSQPMRVSQSYSHICRHYMK